MGEKFVGDAEDFVREFMRNNPTVERVESTPDNVVIVEGEVVDG